MKRKTKLFAVISVVCVMLTLSVATYAFQENNSDIPHEHDIQVTEFNEGVAECECAICEEEKQQSRFDEHINEREYELLDMNGDGIVNAKDYGYLIKNY